MRYRLRRRGREVIEAIEKFAASPVTAVLDLGTADGRMLDAVKKRYPGARCVGIELSEELVDFARRRFPDIKVVHGDIQEIKFAGGSFDAVIAAAVIEHVPSPERVIGEAWRLLRDGGTLILTTPAPFWEHLATAVGHLEEEDHNEALGLERLQKLVVRQGFKVLKVERFMLSPMGIPFESALERAIRALGLDFLLSNQLLAAQKEHQ